MSEILSKGEYLVDGVAPMHGRDEDYYARVGATIEALAYALLYERATDEYRGELFSERGAPPQWANLREKGWLT